MDGGEWYKCLGCGADFDRLFKRHREKGERVNNPTSFEPIEN